MDVFLWVKCTILSLLTRSTEERIDASALPCCRILLWKTRVRSLTRTNPHQNCLSQNGPTFLLTAAGADCHCFHRTPSVFRSQFAQNAENVLILSLDTHTHRQEWLQSCQIMIRSSVGKGKWGNLRSRKGKYCRPVYHIMNLTFEGKGF